MDMKKLREGYMNNLSTVSNSKYRYKGNALEETYMLIQMLAKGNLIDNTVKDNTSVHPILIDKINEIIIETPENREITEFINKAIADNNFYSEKITKEVGEYYVPVAVTIMLTEVLDILKSSSDNFNLARRSGDYENIIDKNDKLLEGKLTNHTGVDETEIRNIFELFHNKDSSKYMESNSLITEMDSVNYRHLDAQAYNEEDSKNLRLALLTILEIQLRIEEQTGTEEYLLKLIRNNLADRIENNVDEDLEHFEFLIIKDKQEGTVTPIKLIELQQMNRVELEETVKKFPASILAIEEELRQIDINDVSTSDEIHSIEGRKKSPFYNSIYYHLKPVVESAEKLILRILPIALTQKPDETGKVIMNKEMLNKFPLIKNKYEPDMGTEFKSIVQTEKEVQKINDDLYYNNAIEFGTYLKPERAEKAMNVVLQVLKLRGSSSTQIENNIELIINDNFLSKIGNPEYRVEDFETYMIPLVLIGNIAYRTDDNLAEYLRVMMGYHCLTVLMDTNMEDWQFVSTDGEFKVNKLGVKDKGGLIWG